MSIDGAKKMESMKPYDEMGILKLRSSKSGSDRPLRAKWAKTAAPPWIAAQLRYGSCSSLNEASFSTLVSVETNSGQMHLNAAGHEGYPDTSHLLAKNENMCSKITSIDKMNQL